jgi:hypothetical protein
VEKVSNAKSGNGFLAERKNEPSLYYLEAGTVSAIEKAASEIEAAAAPAK